MSMDSKLLPQNKASVVSNQLLKFHYFAQKSVSMIRPLSWGYHYDKEATRNWFAPRIADGLAGERRGNAMNKRLSRACQTHLLHCSSTTTKLAFSISPSKLKETVHAFIGTSLTWIVDWPPLMRGERSSEFLGRISREEREELEGGERKRLTKGIGGSPQPRWRKDGVEQWTGSREDEKESSLSLLASPIVDLKFNLFFFNGLKMTTIPFIKRVKNPFCPPENTRSYTYTKVGFKSKDTLLY